jgi:hypothetical protein
MITRFRRVSFGEMATLIRGTRVRARTITPRMRRTNRMHRMGRTKMIQRRGSGARVADEKKDEEGEDVAGEKKTEAEQSARLQNKRRVKKVRNLREVESSRGRVLSKRSLLKKLILGRSR